MVHRVRGRQFKYRVKRLFGAFRITKSRKPTFVQQRSHMLNQVGTVFLGTFPTGHLHLAHNTRLGRDQDSIGSNAHSVAANVLGESPARTGRLV